MTTLACYKIRDRIGGKVVNGFDDVVDFEAWHERIELQLETGDVAVAAKLFVAHSAERDPDWLKLLREGFGPDLTIGRAPAPGALLVVRVQYRRRPAYIAFTFGIGRHLLKDNAYERSFGLKVALNAIFEGDQGEEGFDASRLRSVIAKRVSANTLRLQGQVNRSAALEDFDVDLERDLVDGVTGAPVDGTAWGVRISGSDAFHLSVPVEFGELPKLCRQLLRTHDRTDYRSRFSWIDNISRVSDPDRVEVLEAAVSEQLRQQVIADLELAVPELVEWQRVHHFRFPHDRRNDVRRPELQLSDYLGWLNYRGQLADISADWLQRRRIDALDGNGEVAYAWSIWRCLAGEIKVDGSMYVIDDGDFYEVAADYMKSLDTFLRRRVPETSLALPQNKSGRIEVDYNRGAAAAGLGLLLMDRRNVKTDRSTTAVEVCDLLSIDRQLVHVKRKLGSSLLSHLFAQGRVSADLLATNGDFRSAAQGKIEEACSEAGEDYDHFNFVSETGIDPTRFEVVYGIIADWRGASLVERLPFFSKVNLRRCVDDLQRLQFRVTHCRIEEVP